MKIINTPSGLLKPGMILFEDLYNSYGAIILYRDTLLDEKHIQKIYMNNIHKVRIKVPERDETPEQKALPVISIFDREKIGRFKKKYTEKVDEVTSVIKEIGRGGAVDIEEVNAISKHLVRNFGTLSDMVNYMHLVRPMDDYTYSHSLNVSLMSIVIAKWMNFTDSQIDEIATAGLLHDIGKTRVPQSILCKPEKLTQEEFDEIKKHTLLGYLMVDNIKDVPRQVKYSVLMHHEKIDGSGYPIGIADHEIPLYPKIVAVADIYDAMTSNRSYRAKMCPFDVIRNFEMQTFGKLDTQVLTVFLKNIANSYVGDFVELNTGEIAQIVFINPNRVWQPIVKSGNECIDLSKEEGKRYITQIV